MSEPDRTRDDDSTLPIGADDAGDALPSDVRDAPRRYEPRGMLGVGGMGEVHL